MYGLMDFDNDGGELPITDRPYLPEAADCMRCGVCLSVCPTYKLGGDEKQGPRSRVNSLRRLLQQGQTLDAEDQEQLQSCVQCRACESVCPSRMDYAVMFDRAGERLAAGKRAPVLARAAFF